MSNGGEDLDALFGEGERPDLTAPGRAPDDTRPPGLMWPPPSGHVPLPLSPPPPVEFTVDAPPGAVDDELDQLPWEVNPFAKLTPKQARLLAELMTSDTIEAACEQAGVAPRTARRWMAEKDFGLAMRKAVIDRAAHAVNQLGLHVGDAVAVLAELLKNDNANVRLKAAVAIVTQALHGIAFKVAKEDFEQFAEWMKARIDRNRKLRGGGS